MGAFRLSDGAARSSKLGIGKEVCCCFWCGRQDALVPFIHKSHVSPSGYHPSLPPSLPFLEKLIPPFIKFNTDVHTPNKRRLGASERLRESQQEKRRRGAGGPPSGGLNCALNRSEAPPPCWRWQGMACLPAFVDRPKYALLCVRAYASKYMWFLAIFMLC